MYWQVVKKLYNYYIVIYCKYKYIYYFSIFQNYKLAEKFMKFIRKNTDLPSIGIVNSILELKSNVKKISLNNVQCFRVYDFIQLLNRKYFGNVVRNFYRAIKLYVKHYNYIAKYFRQNMDIIALRVSRDYTYFCRELITFKPDEYSIWRIAYRHFNNLIIGNASLYWIIDDTNVTDDNVHIEKEIELPRNSKISDEEIETILNLFD